MYVPEFKNVIMPTLTAALDEWRDDAEKSEWGFLGGRGGEGVLVERRGKGGMTDNVE